MTKNNINSVAPERTGWRDEALSRRHREYGFDCPAVDIDFLLIEFNKAEPVALIEYKHENAPPQYPSHPSFQALIKLGSRACIPVFAARYKSDFSSWTVVPLNKVAKNKYQRKEMSEYEYISFLYMLRDKKIPKDVLKFK